MNVYYLLYILVYFDVVWGWYILSGTNPDVEVNLIIAFVMFSIPSFLPEILVRIIGNLYISRNKEIKKVCEEMRVYAIIGNTILIGIILNSYDTNASIFSFLGYVLFGFLISYLPMLGLWMFSDYLALVLRSKKNIKNYFKSSAKLGELLKIIKDCGNCQGYPGVPGIIFMCWRGYGPCRGIFLELYWRVEEEKWIKDSYNRVKKGIDSSLSGKSFVHLIDNTSYEKDDENNVIRHFFVLGCENELIANSFMKKMFSLLQSFAKKSPDLKIHVSNDERSSAKCRRITIRYD